jgi:RNA polymerase sigma-70 factor (ECF subfamily)
VNYDTIPEIAPVSLKSGRLSGLLLELRRLLGQPHSYMRTTREKPFTPDQREDQTASDRKALDELVERLYSKLKALAARVRWRTASPTLSATALVQEAYLKLLSSKDLTSKSHDEVLSIFAHVMRQIMSDAARRKRSQKRGGGALVALATEHRDSAAQRERTISPEDVLTLEAALDELRIISERQADIMDRRHYLGLTVEETARVMRISKTMVEREERSARKFLEERIRPRKS